MQAPKSDFNQLLKVLDRKKPDRPVLFEFFMNCPLYSKLASKDIVAKYGQEESECGLASEARVFAFANAGYDYTTTPGSCLSFPREEIDHKASHSINAFNTIKDRDTFNSYKWPNPDDFDYSSLDTLKEVMPNGMKLVVNGPGGILENAIVLVGYENLCLMMLDNPKLTSDLFGRIGETLVRHYEIACSYDSVGACISNDDWGFKTQTMLSPEDMRKYVIPWHKKITDKIHECNRPVILHSCGMLYEVMDDIIGHIGYDGKHSYEDAIDPVESAYDKLADRIAVLGGIDLDYVCRNTPQKIYDRSRKMLEKAANSKGGYALGTGNSVPEYCPDENYLAMINAARNMRNLESLIVNV